MSNKRWTGTRECKGCGLGYTYEDTRVHNAMHRRWEAASLRFGTLRVYALLEAAKMTAYHVMHSDAPIEAKADAIVAVVRAHFERSVSQSGFRAWKVHPSFETYARAYDVRHACPADAWGEFRSRYPFSPSSHLRPGYSYWE
jgi:hypothetical protein